MKPWKFWGDSHLSQAGNRHSDGKGKGLSARQKQEISTESIEKHLTKGTELETHTLPAFFLLIERKATRGCARCGSLDAISMWLKATGMQQAALPTLLLAWLVCLAFCRTAFASVLTAHPRTPHRVSLSQLPGRQSPSIPPPTLLLGT